MTQPSLSLASSFTLSNGQTIKNRLFKSAMSEQLGTKDHQPTDGLVTLYGRWANGGIGLAMTGNIMISRTALGEPKNVVLDEHSDLEIFKRWAEAGKQNGAQIHGAHGYLVSQFLSPRHNTRDDQWGGPLQNRMRFVLSVYEAIREQVGDDFPIGIKLNSADFMKGGFSEDDSMEVVQALANAGINLIEISGGTYESPSMMGKGAKQSTIDREAYFLDYMEKVRKLVDTPLVVTGGFRSGPAMLKALQSGATDFVGLARTVAIDTEFPNKLLADDRYSMTLSNPSTGSRAMDAMAMIGITWYEQQLARIANGKDPKANLSAWSVVAKTLLGAGFYAFKKRRA